MYRMYQPIKLSDYSYNDPRPNQYPPTNPIEGTKGNDVIHGTAMDDYIFGRDGVDYLYGNQGNDVIRTGGSSKGGDFTMLADDYAGVASGTILFMATRIGISLMADMTMTC